jgi:hypothetical protein
VAVEKIQQPSATISKKLYVKLRNPSSFPSFKKLLFSRLFQSYLIQTGSSAVDFRPFSNRLFIDDAQVNFSIQQKSYMFDRNHHLRVITFLEAKKNQSYRFVRSRATCLYQVRLRLFIKNRFKQLTPSNYQLKI